MKTTKHFVLVALLVFGTAAPAMAGTSKGSLYPVGDEPNASGYYSVQSNRQLNLSAKVSCSNLTPGESYYAVLWYEDFDTRQYTGLLIGSFVADSNGDGNTGWASARAFFWDRIEVYSVSSPWTTSTCYPRPTERPQLKR